MYLNFFNLWKRILLMYSRYTMYGCYTTNCCVRPSIVSILSYINNESAQAIPTETETLVTWEIFSSSNSCGRTGLSIIEGKTFRNTSPYPINISVNGYIGWNTGGTVGTLREVFIAKNANTSTERLCNVNTTVGSSTDYPALNFSASMRLEVNDYFQVYCLHNDATDQEINAPLGYPGSRINIMAFP